MLARFFKKSEPLGFISILLLIVVYIIIQIFLKIIVVNDLKNVATLLGVFVLFSSFIFLTDFIVKKNQLTPSNYYAIFVFALLVGLFPSVLTFSKISFSYFFVLLATRRIFSIQTKKQLLLKLYDSGFYVGVAFLLFPSTGLFFFLILASYSIYIHVISKDIFIPVVGFLTPVFIVFTYYFFIDNMSVFKTMTELNLYINFDFISNKKVLIALLSIGLLVLWGLIKVFLNRHHAGVQWKKSNKLVVFFLLIGIIISLTNSVAFEKTVFYLFFPIAIIIGNLVVLTQKYWIKQTILFVLFVLTFMLPFL